MDERKNAIFTTAILTALVMIFMVVDFFDGTRLFSETENRVLAQKPVYSKEALLSGEYTMDYEEYITDQFVSRDKWIGIKTAMDQALQRKEINGVYMGTDNYLFEVHKPAAYTEEMEQEKLALLAKLTERWDAKVMIVPTADNVISEKLPAHAVCYDQAAFLEKVRETVGEDRYIDAYAALNAHKEEQIYYRTDHHWTTRGAYYGYLAWAQSMRICPYPYSFKQMEVASDNFKGTLHSKINVEVQQDVIEYFPRTDARIEEVIYDGMTSTQSLYEESHLDTKNQYGFFMDDNHALVEIRTKWKNGKTLFVLKDSYANCMIPFLADHYETIYVMDLRYFRGRLFQYMESMETEDMDVLVLYNCIHFLEEFKYL